MCIDRSARSRTWTFMAARWSGRHVSERHSLIDTHHRQHRAGAQRRLQVPGHRRGRDAAAVPAVAAAGLAGRAGHGLDRLLLPRSRRASRRCATASSSRPATAASAPSSTCARRPSWASATTSALRISIFLSVFDVHINRAPVAGRIARSIYVPGSFLNAALDKASEENERRGIVIATAGRHRDRRRADRRPDRAAHRHLRQRGRQRRRRRARSA